MTESETEYDNWAQDQAAMDLEDKAPASEVARWADVAMYPAAPAADIDDIRPRVTLISMTPNPLRVIAAASELYKGQVIHDPFEITRETALGWLDEITKSAIQAPLEFVDIHLLFEDVTRAFTHQLVRQRTAVFVQESQRFAVKENAEFEVAMPPSIAKLHDDDPRRVAWAKTINFTAHSYMALINAGVPAEDARGVLPTNITTKVHYKTNLRSLVEHSGMRLCSQAQHEWKTVWSGIVREIIDYGPVEEAWQQRAISRLFKPICYQTGKCEFMAATDRHCDIRDRVMAHYAKGEGPEEWGDIHQFEPIREGAARIPPEMA